MFETKVIGNKEWAMAFLTDADIRCLEDFDCEMRIRCLLQREGRRKTKTYEDYVERWMGRQSTSRASGGHSHS